MEGNCSSSVICFEEFHELDLGAMDDFLPSGY